MRIFNLFKYLVSAFIFIAILACDAPAIIDLPVNPHKLTLNFIGENGIPWQGTVGLSTGILQNHLDINTGQLIAGTTVRIFENGKPIEPVNPGPNWGGSWENVSYMTMSFSPKAGSTYRIEAESENYGTAFSTYTHPYPVNVDAMEVKRLGKAGLQENREPIEMKITFLDPPGEDYYEFFLIASDESGNDIANLSLNFIDPAYEIPEEYPIITICNDDLFDGKKITLVFKSTLPLDFVPLTKCKIGLYHLSKEYYEYEKTLVLQETTKNDPYAQPVKVKNNIENGFGIFGGFNPTFKTVKIE